MSFTTPSATSTSSSSSLLNVSGGGNGAPLQITGLASGLDTNAVISALMSIEQQPLTNLQNQQKGLQALNGNLSSIQSALQGLVSSAQALSSVSLFSNTQTATSTNPTLVSATTNSGVGAVVGGYQIAVTGLATAAQQTFNFASPAAQDTVTVGQGSNSRTYNLNAGAQPQDLVDAINADSSGLVWGTVVNGQVVLSNRTTGAASTFSVSDTGGALSLQSSTAGHDAQFTVNNGATQTSASNTVTTAIPGVTLTLGGVTGSGGPVTVSVGAPSISTSAIQTAVQNFVSSYNSVVNQIQTQLSQSPSRSDPTQGQLYGDPELNDLLSNIRQSIYQGGSGLPAGMASLMDLGVSTGATTGSSVPSQTAISGQLTLDANALTQAITSNPSGVTNVLKAFSQNFTNLVNPVAQPGGSIDSRVQGDNQQISDLTNQISNMQAALSDRQNQLQQQFAQLEALLSQNQSTESWLSSQISALPTP